MKCAILYTFIYIVTAEVRNPSHIVTQPKKHEMKRLKDGTRQDRSDWTKLDFRPLPEWYDRAKVGIFLHWGIYSVPAYVSEWFWLYWREKNEDIAKFMERNYPPPFEYKQFTPMFTAKYFDPDKWARLFKMAGAKYVVLTSKHHEGFTLFPSNQSNGWNSVEEGPHRDLVGDLSEAVRRVGLKFGVYYSLYEWFNEDYIKDKEANFTSYNYRDKKVMPDLKQLVHDYKPSVIWSDGGWEASDKYWNSTNFLTWLYDESPVKDRVVVNDRWGKNTNCKHGDFYNCVDRYNPRTLQEHKWENAFTLDKKSWGYRRNMNFPDEVLTIKELLNEVVSTVSCGGNVLINIGPTKEATIDHYFQRRLLQLGIWLKINGEAIYNSSPWLHQNDSINGDVWYTCKKTKYNTSQPYRNNVLAIYAIILKWPKNDLLELGAITTMAKTKNHLELLDSRKKLPWSIQGRKVHVKLPDKATLTSKYAWTLKWYSVPLKKKT